MSNQPNPVDLFWAERYRHGPVTADDIHQGYDAVIEAFTAVREAEIRTSLAATP